MTTLPAIVQQSAFQAAPLPASVPVMDAVEPTVAVLIGVFAFAEHLGTAPVALACEAAGIVAVIGGVVLLDRSPVVLSLQRGWAEEQHDQPPRAAPTSAMCE